MTLAVLARYSIYTMSRIIISLPDELLNELDKYAKFHLYNRSECVRHAIRLLIENQEERYEYNEFDGEETIA